MSRRAHISQKSPSAAPPVAAPKGSFLGKPSSMVVPGLNTMAESDPAVSTSEQVAIRQSTPVTMQPKLTIGTPDDMYEREADSVADQVMRMPDPVAAGAVPNGEGGETPPDIQRHPGADDDEHLDAKESAGQTPAMTSETESSINELRGGGEPMPETLRTYFEPRFGYDFSNVRVHAGERADQAARSVQARAFTLGRDVVFAAGEYSPGTSEGNRLLAHELTHVVQQGGASQQIQRSFGTQSDEPRGISPERKLDISVSGSEETPDLQREVDPSAVTGSEQTPTTGQPATAGDGSVPAQTPPPPPPPAVPTVTLTPGATLVRGNTLTATVSFTPTAGETLTVTGWSYATAQDTVTRAATDPGFSTGWGGIMALSGTLTMNSTVTPAGGTAAAAPAVTHAITVDDRTGAPWASTVTDQAERTYAGQPAPPQLFRHLGLHEANATLPSATGTAITSGPNTGFNFVSALTAGTFTSRPNIHGNLTTATSAFARFHQNPSRLYLVNGATRTLIPITEYSNLVASSTGPTFDVTDWEAFYKRHNFYTVTATSGGASAVCQAAWWGLDANTAAAGLIVRNAAAIRAALGIASTDAFQLSATSNGGWDGYQLMQTPAILSGTQSHEYQHATHSHRANFHKMMRALDPQRKIEKKVSTPSQTVVFATQINDYWTEIIKPNHELVDEAASQTAEAFVAATGTMAGVNTNPATGAFLGSVWDITNDTQMS